MRRVSMSFLLVLSLGLVGSSAFADQNNQPTMSDLTAMDQDNLDALYLESSSGVMPDGDSEGRAVMFAGSILQEPTTFLASLAWQGKIFDAQDAVLVNKVFGFRAVTAKIYKGESYFDGKEAIIVDYQDTSLLFGSVRDEIRQVGNGLYLGRAYIRTWIGPVFALNFILQFDNQ